MTACTNRHRVSLTQRRVLLWILLLWLAFAVRVVSLEAQGLWRDEVDALNFATAPWEELVAKFTKPGENGPLYLVLLRGWVALTGRSAFGLRYFSLLWGVLGCVLFYVLGCRLVGKGAALWAAVLVSFSPYWVWYAEEVKMYTWVPALVLLALYALDRACVRPRWYWWGVLVVATSFAFYSHILAALLIPVEVVWFFLHPCRNRHAWLGGAASLALLTLPYLPLLRWQARLALVVRETGFPSYTLSQMAQMLLSAWSTGIAGWGVSVGPILFAGLAVLGVGALFWQQHWRRALFLVAWVAVPLLTIWAVSLRGPIFTDRYLIWTSPAFYLAVGAGIAFLRRYSDKLAALCFLALLLFEGVNLYRQVALPIKPQFREVAAYLQSNRDPEDLLLFQIPYNHIVVAYYMDVPLDPYAKAAYTNWRTEDGGYLWGPEEVAAVMRSLLGGHKGVWLVYSESAMWDERALVKAWLDVNASLEVSQPFMGVELFYYDLQGP